MSGVVCLYESINLFPPKEEMCKDGCEWCRYLNDRSKISIERTMLNLGFEPHIEMPRYLIRDGVTE